MVPAILRTAATSRHPPHRLLRLLRTNSYCASASSRPATARLLNPRRAFSSSSPSLSGLRDAVVSLLPQLPAPLIPPAVFVALAAALWAYKCAMMVLLQNRIIYMPSMPPFSRSETIADYEALCRPVVWEQRRIVAEEDGTQLALALGQIPMPNNHKQEHADTEAQRRRRRRRVLVLYFQGNGSSTPPRLPMLSAVLRSLHHSPTSTTTSTHYTIAALAYRGYWSSRGRPSQPGIERDARAALAWAAATFAEEDTRVVLWGQSLGAAVATGLLANHNNTTPTTTDPGTDRVKEKEKRLPVSGLLLETPFLSIKAMLHALYPQRWLPYRYLAPFLRNHWDSDAALRRLSPSSPSSPSKSSASSSSPSPPVASHLPVLILSAANDELVPADHAPALERTCRAVGLRDVRRRAVPGALHNDATVRAEGRDAVVRFLREVADTGGQKR